MESVPTQLSNFPSFLIYILFNPSLNPVAAIIVYSAIAVFLLLILVVGILFIMRTPKDEQTSGEQDQDGGEELSEPVADESLETSGPDEGVPAPREARPSRRVKVAAPPMSTRARLVVAVVAGLVVVAAWGITGYTTSDSELCKNCHWPAAEHATALQGSDMHANATCVSCHESGGTLGRYFAGVPARLMHFATSQSSDAPRGEYGHVTVSSCSACHASALEGVASNEARGLKISHKEPLAAYATCIDCHTLQAGVVGAHNVGMEPCLRCHDSKSASSKCATCHDEKAAAAARARTASFATAQIADVSCGGCHNEKKDCDWCHGLRLPHTTEFKMYAHSRAGAVDFWYNEGKTCSRCHTASRRPCQKCHGVHMGHEHGVAATWLASAHKKATVNACDTCHGQFAYSASRDFCKDICHTPAAIEASPR